MLTPSFVILNAYSVFPAVRLLLQSSGSDFSRKIGFCVCIRRGRMLYYILSYLRRDGRVVEGAALEMLYRGNSIVGSNPTLSAIFTLKFGKFAPFVPIFLDFSPFE